MRRSTDVVHVGLNKSASSWLQRTVLPQVTSHAVVGRFPGSDRSLLDVVALMQTAPAFAAGTLRAKAEEVAGGRGPILLTDEGLSSTLRFDTQEQFDRNVVRLQGEFPDARVLLVIRRQPDLILSSYGQYVRKGGTATLARFVSGAPVVGYRHRFERYDLHRIVATFQASFGADDVVVVPFEWLKLDPARFVRESFARLHVDVAGCDEIVALASKPVHPSASSVGRAVHRRLNRLPLPDAQRVRRLMDRAVDRGGRLGKLRPLEQRISDRDRALMRSVGEQYAASNRALADLTGLPLEDLAYPLP